MELFSDWSEMRRWRMLGSHEKKNRN